jgi:hypothetical protein
MAKDPTCGLSVAEETAKYKSDNNGETIISAQSPARQHLTKTQPGT